LPTLKAQIITVVCKVKIIDLQFSMEKSIVQLSYYHPMKQRGLSIYHDYTFDLSRHTNFNENVENHLCSITAACVADPVFNITNSQRRCTLYVQAQNKPFAFRNSDWLVVDMSGLCAFANMFTHRTVGCDVMIVEYRTR